MYKERLVQIAAENDIIIRQPARNHAIVSYGRGRPVTLEVNFWSVDMAIGITLLLHREQMNPENNDLFAAFEQAYHAHYPQDLLLPNAQRSPNRRKVVIRHDVNFDPTLELDQDFQEGLDWHITRLQYVIDFLLNHQ